MSKKKKQQKNAKSQIPNKLIDFDKSIIKFLGFCSFAIAIGSGILAMPLEPFDLFTKKFLFTFFGIWSAGTIGFLVIFLKGKERNKSDQRKKKDK